MRHGSFSKLAVVLVLAAALAAPALAAPPAPTFMPGFPMLAGNLVMIMWVPVPGAVKYKVFMNGQEVGEAVAPPFQAPAPQAAGQYAFEIAGVDATGALGAKSPAATLAIVKLEPPGELAYLPGVDGVTVRWKTPVGVPIVNVYRAAKKEGPFDMLVSLQDQKYLDKDAKAGQTYYYRLTSKDVSGKESDPSAVLEVQVPEAAAAAVQSKKAEIKARAMKITEFPSKVQPPAVALDVAWDADRIYVCNSRTQKVEAYDYELNLLETIGEQGYMEGQYVFPVGVGVTSRGDIVVADSERKVVIVYSPKGEFQWEVEVPAPETENAQDPNPGVLAVGKNDEIWVADASNTRLVRFDSRGEFLGSFGGRQDKDNKGPGFMVGIGYVSADADGYVYAGDIKAGYQHVFDPDGKGLVALGYGQGVGAIIQPGESTAVMEDGKKLVWVPDSMLGTIQAFDLESGDYRYTLTNEEGKIDTTKTKAEWDLGDMRFLTWDPKARAAWTWNVSQGILYKLEPVK